MTTLRVSIALFLTLIVSGTAVVSGSLAYASPLVHSGALEVRSFVGTESSASSAGTRFSQAGRATIGARVQHSRVVGASQHVKHQMSLSLLRGAQAQYRTMEARSLYARTNSVNNANSLKTSWSLWPSGSYNETGGTVDAAWADDPSSNFFDMFTDGSGNNYIHSVSYTDSGMLGGYAQAANITIGSNGDVGAGFWLGSYYPSSSEAGALVSDAESTLASSTGTIGTACGAGWPSNCQIFVFGWSDTNGNDHTTAYSVFSVGNAVGESAMDAFTQTVNGNTDEWAADAADIAVAGLKAVTASGPPQKPTIKITSVFLLEQINGKSVEVRQAPLWRKVLLVIVYKMSVSGAYAKNGHVLFTGPRVKETKALSHAALSDGTTFFGTFKKFKSKTWLGTVRADYSLTVGPAHKSGEVHFRVVPFR